MVVDSMVLEMATKMTMTAAAIHEIYVNRADLLPFSNDGRPTTFKKLVTSVAETRRSIGRVLVRIIAVELIMAIIKPIKTAFGR